MGRLMAMSFLGQLLGSLVVAVMVRYTLVSNVFIVALVVNGLSIVVIITFLQDSLSDRPSSVVLCKL